MTSTVIALLLCAFMATATGNPAAATAASQRFQADKFLDMLGKSYDSKIAYVDLLSALHKRLNLDVANQSNGSASTVDGGSTNFNAMAETTANCQEAPPRKGATVTYTSETRVSGSRALYQCEPGYEGKSKFIQCLQGGEWSLSTDREGCNPVDCGPVLPNVQNADSSFTLTTFGSVVSYSCHAGYNMNFTNATVTCLTTGIWDTPNFICEKGNVPPHPMMALLQSMPGFSGLPSMPNTGVASGPSVLPSTSNNNNPMAAMFAQMFPNFVPPTPPTPAPSTTSKPVVRVAPGGFQLPSHLQNLLPNGLSSTSGIRPQDLMTLASVGLGSANPAIAPKDLSQLLGTMNPMSIFGGAMGLNLGGPSMGGGAAGAGPGAAPVDPEVAAEQREEMMMRAMMASAMKSMMGPSSHANTTSNHNPAMDVMSLMALQGGLSGGAGGAGAGGAGWGTDPLAMMLGGMGGGGGGGLFGGMFGQA